MKNSEFIFILCNIGPIIEGMLPKYLLLSSLFIIPTQANWLTIPAHERDKYIGKNIKKILETYHYRQLSIDNSFSQKAFEQFLKEIDSNKRFLLQKDVDSLKKFDKKIDDEMEDGDFQLLKSAQRLLKDRIKTLDEHREVILKKPFDFDKKESLEWDADKRKFFKSISELKNYWRKIFKYETMTEYITLTKQQKEKSKQKKDTKKKKEPLLSKKELRKKARKEISKRYRMFFNRLSTQDHDDHLEDFFNAVSNVFDPHTSYLPPKRKEDFDIDISGSLEGIGAILEEDDIYIKVNKIVIGGAAWQQNKKGKGLGVGDYILRVQEKKTGKVTDLVGKKASDAVTHIRGKKGTTVVLYVKKPDGRHVHIPIIRDVIELNANFAKGSVIGHKKFKHKIGHIQVPKFYRDFGNNRRNCTDDVKMELDRLKALKVNAIILDLRNNGGGALEDARQMTGLFIKKGPVVQVRDHAGKIEVLEDKDSSILYDGPMIVMINRFSASASEILAGALQDYRRAIIVGGAYSHGKGSVQAILNLSQGPIDLKFGHLKLTIQMFYRITGSSTQYRGITPDIILPDPFEHIKNREKDLEYSLPWEQVPKRTFTVWNKQKYNLPALKKQSQNRVEANKRFKKINTYIDYLNKKSSQTSVSLNFTDIMKDEKDSEKMAKKMKEQEENKQITIANYQSSLKPSKIKPENKKRWEEDFKKRTQEWKKEIRSDPLLEESIYIIDDMIRMAAKV